MLRLLHIYFIPVTSIVDEKTPFTTKASIKTEISKETPKSRKDVLSKRSGVTKIGNNTYYYTGKFSFLL